MAAVYFERVASIAYTVAPSEKNRIEINDKAVSPECGNSVLAHDGKQGNLVVRLVESRRFVEF
jgi:hypothetical protein